MGRERAERGRGAVQYGTNGRGVRVEIGENRRESQDWRLITGHYDMFGLKA